MSYERPVSICDSTASDLSGEIIAALSSASMVFKEDNEYSGELINAAKKLYDVASKEEPGHKQVKYTEVDACGEEARKFYNSSGFQDELVWGGTWLFFATGNTSYLAYSTERFKAAEVEEKTSEKGIFYWNNKLTANMVNFVVTFAELSKEFEFVLKVGAEITF